MTTHDQNHHAETLPPVSPASRMLDAVSTAKSAWLEARSKQNSAATMTATIRQRREETETESRTLNEEWRQLFRENQGAMTPRMKKLRAEIALGRETLEEFGELMNAHAAETEFLPWNTADEAHHYIRQHNTLLDTHAAWLWAQFLKEHGHQLMQVLSLLRLTLGRNATIISGTVHSVNDTETVLKNFIAENITRPALSHPFAAQDDPFLCQVGVHADEQAYLDVRNAPSPAARSRMLRQREMNAGGHRE